MGNQKVKVYFYGLMANYMMANGNRVKNMDQEFGKELKEIPILDNGKMVVLMDMEFIFGLMEIVMKANLNQI